MNLVLLAVLFGFTLMVFAFMGWLGLRVAKSADEPVEGSRLTKNQWRALAWLVGILICLIGAAIEFTIIFGGD